MQRFALLKIQYYFLNIAVKVLLFNKLSSDNKIRKNVFLRYINSQYTGEN